MFNFKQVKGNAKAQVLVALTQHEEGSIHALVVENTSLFDHQITVTVNGNPIAVDAPKGTSYPQLKLNLPPAAIVEVTAPVDVRVSGSYIKQPIDNLAAGAVVNVLVQEANAAADRAEGAVPAGVVDDSTATASNVYSAEKVEEIATQLGDQATLSRSAFRNQIDVIQMKTPKHAPLVAVTREDPQLGVTNNQWDVDVDGSNFDRADYTPEGLVFITEKGNARPFARAYSVQLQVGEFDPATEGMVFITGGAKAVIQEINGNVATLRGHDELPLGLLNSGKWEIRDVIPDENDGLTVARVLGTTAGIMPDLDHSLEWIYNGAGFSIRNPVATATTAFVPGSTALAATVTEMRRSYSPDGRWGYVVRWSTVSEGILQVLRAPLGNRWDFTTRLYNKGELHTIAEEGPWGSAAASQYLVTDDHHIYLFRDSNTNLEVCKVKVSSNEIDYVRNKDTKSPITFNMRTTDTIPTGYATGVEWGADGRKVYIILSSGHIAQYSTATPYQLEGAEFEVVVVRPSGLVTETATLTWLDDGRWMIELTNVSGNNGMLRVGTPYDLGTKVRSNTVTYTTPVDGRYLPIYLNRPGARTGAWAHNGSSVQLPTHVTMYMPSAAYTYGSGGVSATRDRFYDPYADLVVDISRNGSSSSTLMNLTVNEIDSARGVATASLFTSGTFVSNNQTSSRVWMFNGHVYYAAGGDAGRNLGLSEWYPPASNPDDSYVGIGGSVAFATTVVPMPLGTEASALAEFWVSEDGTRAMIATVDGQLCQYTLSVPYDPRSMALVDVEVDAFPATVPSYHSSNRVWFGPNGEWVGYSDLNNPNTIKRRYFGQPGVVTSIIREDENYITVNQTHSPNVRFSHRTGHLRLGDILYPSTESANHIYGNKVAITNANTAKLDTSLWTNVDSVSVEMQGTGGVEFLFSIDGKQSFFTYTYSDELLTVRPVMKLVNGAWRINNAVAFDGVNWVAPEATDMLEVAIEASKLPHNTMTDGELTAVGEYFPLGETLDMIGLMHEGSGLYPTSLSSVSFNYDANVTHRGAILGVDYVYDTHLNDSVRIHYLKAGNYKVRVL